MAIAPTSNLPLPVPADNATKSAEANAPVDQGGFLALLNIGIIQPDEAGTPASGMGGGKPANASASSLSISSGKKDPDRQDTPEAAAIEAPAPIENAPRPKNAAAVSANEEAVQAATQKDSPAGHAAPDNRAAPQADNAQDSPAAPASASPGHSEAAAAGAPPTTAQESETAEDAAISAALKEQLVQVDQILQAIIQALSTGAIPAAAAAPIATDASNAPAALAVADTALPLPAATNPADTITPPVGTTLLQDIATSGFIAETSGTESTASGTIAIPEAAAPHDAQKEIALLEDIRSLLQKMLQALQGDAKLPGQPATPQAAPAPNVDGDAAQAATPNATNLQALLNQLQKDIRKLSSLWPQNASASAHAPEITLPSTASPTAVAATLPPITDNGGEAPYTVPSPFAEQFKASIAQIRTELQKLSQDNEDIYLQAKNVLQAQFEKAKLFFQPSSNVNEVTLQPATGSEPVVSIQSAPSAAHTVSASVQAEPQSVTQLTVSSVQFVHGTLDTSSDSNPDSGGGQRQPGLSLPASTPGTSASGSTASNPEHSAFAKALNRTSSASLPEQVVFQIKTALTDGSSKIRIQLDPADLGKMDIKLNVDAQGKTGVIITVENKATLDLLQRDAQGLARALNDAGLSTDSGSLSFNLRGGEQEQNKNPQAALTYKKAQPEEEEELVINVLTRSYVVNLAEGLDIKI
jgi:flagellar hook-length control protein FliK